MTKQKNVDIFSSIGHHIQHRFLQGIDLAILERVLI